MAIVVRHGSALRRGAGALRVAWYFGQKLLARRAAAGRMPAPRRRSRAMPDRARLLADLRALLEHDWRNIEAGLYRLPEDCRRRPARGVAQAGRFFADLRRVEARRRADANDEIFRRRRQAATRAITCRTSTTRPTAISAASSAELYDHQVEVLFGGGADAMRRQALVPLRTRARRNAACAARRCSISPAAPGASCARSRATTRASR